jgi:hypothetical protein
VEPYSTGSTFEQNNIEQGQIDCKVKTDYLGYDLILLMIIYAGQTIIINNENQH